MFGLERPRDGRNMTGTDHAGVGNQKGAAEAKALGELADAIDGATPEHDPRARFKIERDHLR